MSRKKKTRSLSRVHGIKTGSISKLKRAEGTDRQTGKRVKNKVKSVFDKFLDENPEAKKELVREQAIKAKASAETKNKAASELNAKIRAVREKQEARQAARAAEAAEKEDATDLLDLLEKKDLGDFY
jgi:hypothetical protein